MGYLRRKNRYLVYYFRYSVTKSSKSGELLFILKKKNHLFSKAVISFYEASLAIKKQNKPGKQSFKARQKAQCCRLFVRYILKLKHLVVSLFQVFSKYLYYFLMLDNRGVEIFHFSFKCFGVSSLLHKSLNIKLYFLNEFSRQETSTI